MAAKKREGISTKTRFEVFKRDKFTCQYCGRKAPEVILHIDHIKPVADGGRSNLLNLVTACVGCNSGKGARLLSDDSVVERQRQQIEELEQRRQQLEMMLEWREELGKLKGRVEDVVCKHIADATGRSPNDTGMVKVRLWLKSFPLDLILSAADDAFGKYGVFESKGCLSSSSWEEAFSKIQSFCRAKQRYGEGPAVDNLLYVQGIIRNRVGNRYFKALDGLKRMQDAGYSFEQMKEAAKRVDDEDDFFAWCFQWLRQE